MSVRAALPVLLTFAALTACGGGDEGLSKADYLSQTEAVCTAAKEEIDALDAELDPSDPAAFEAYFDDSIAAAKKYTDQLVAIEPPADDAEMLKTDFLDPLQGQVDLLTEKLPEIKAALADSDLEALEAVGLDELPEVNEASLREYGLSDACLEVGSTE